MKLLPDKWIYLSACMYASAFIVPMCCDWFVFIFLVPLYWYAVTHHKNSMVAFALQGFWWGLIFFVLHMHAIAYMLAQQASLLQALCAMTCILGYCSLGALCWFAGAAWLSSATKSVTGNLSVWAFATWCYLEFVERFLFRIFFLPRGYVFAYPLVPLLQHEAWLTSVACVPPWLLIFCICIGSAAVTHFLCTYTTLPAILALIWFGPFWVGWLCHDKPLPFPYADFFVYAQPPHYQCNATPLDSAQAINNQLARAVEQFPHVCCICFPESTYPFALDKDHDMRQLWATHALSFGKPELVVIMGGHHSCGNKRTNTLFFFDARRIIYTYDKSLYLPFSEYTPWPWSKSKVLSEFLLKNNNGFHKVYFERMPEQRVNITLACDMQLCPYICSDLFFNYPRTTDGYTTILWLVNDSWFELSYFRHLMLLYAKLQARIYQRPIMYIGHHYGIWLSPSGNHHYLPSVMIPKELN